MRAKKARERPLTAEVKKTKLIDHIFLLNGIAKVRGYEIAPKIKEITTQRVIIFLVFPLLSIISRLNWYPTKAFKKAVVVVNNPSGSVGLIMCMGPKILWSRYAPKLHFSVKTARWGHSPLVKVNMQTMYNVAKNMVKRYPMNLDLFSP